MRTRFLAAALALSIPAAAHAQAPDAVADNGSTSVAQLRHVIGDWDVVTTFYRDDGSVAAEAAGVYSFEWVLEDKIVKGMSTLPEWNVASGLLFYLRPSTSEIEMVSVGPDGQLWTMTGPIDSETRETPVVAMPDGSTLKLRFTRFNVSDDRFESRMERSKDGGETWVEGNHQVFVRRPVEG